MPKTAAAHLSETESGMLPVRTRRTSGLPFLTTGHCKAGSAWVNASIPEVLHSHPKPSGKFGVFHPFQRRADWTAASVDFGEKNSEGNRCTLLYQPRSKQPECRYCQPLRRATKCSEKLQEAPHAVRGRSVNSHSKNKGRNGGDSWA